MNPTLGDNGRILRDDLINAAQCGAVIKAALTAMQATGRFLGGFDHRHNAYDYQDQSTGSWQSFAGREHILSGAVLVYDLTYHGGLICD